MAPGARSTASGHLRSCIFCYSYRLYYVGMRSLCMAVSLCFWLFLQLKEIPLSSWDFASEKWRKDTLQIWVPLSFLPRPWARRHRLFFLFILERNFPLCLSFQNWLLMLIWAKIFFKEFFHSKACLSEPLFYHGLPKFDFECQRLKHESLLFIFLI